MFKRKSLLRCAFFCCVAAALGDHQTAFGGQPQDDPNLVILEAAKLPRDRVGLLKALEATSHNHEDWPRLDKSIRQLGSANLVKRNEATRNVVTFKHAALAELELAKDAGPVEKAMETLNCVLLSPPLFCQDPDVPLLAAPRKSFGDADLRRWLDSDGVKNRDILNLQHSNVSDVGIKYLVELKQLHYLNLAGTKITDAGLKDVGLMTTLRTLHLSNTRVGDLGIKELRLLLALGLLHLDDTLVTDVGVRAIGEFKTLHDLSLAQCAITDSGLPALSGLSNLHALSLRATKVTDQGLTHLKRLINIHNLNLSGTLVTNRGLKQLADFRHLDVIDLDNTRITDGVLDELATHKGLQSLSLRRTAVTDPHLKALTTFQRIHTLNLADTRITGAGLTELVALPKLRDLRLARCKVKDNDIEQLLAVNHQIARLDLSDTRVSDALVPIFTKAQRRLRWLNLKGTDVTLGEVERLRRVLRFCKIDF